MDREKYFTYLKDTSALVSPLILEQVESFCKNEKELKKILMFFYEKRIGRILLKPALFRLSYEVCGGTDFHILLPIAAAFEVLNISSYQANSSFDNKVGVWNKEEKDSQFIASIISREIADKLIDQCERVISHSVLYQIKKCLSTSNAYIYKAQHYDLNLLTINNFNNFKKQEDYLKAYNDRCYFGSGIFSGQCALAGSIAANSNVEEQQSLLKFGELYGTALHQINDLADYFPGDERQSKLYQDNFCDFKNGRLTLPLYLLLNSHNSITASKILSLKNKKDGLLPDDILEVQSFLIEEGVVGFCKGLTMKKFKEAKGYLHCFIPSDVKSLLSVLLSVLDSNKFYYRINKIFV
jgi:hypothetical protein